MAEYKEIDEEHKEENKEEYRQPLKYGEMAKDAVEVGGGFIVSGFTGRFLEDKFKPDVTPISSTSDKIMAGAANNLPKIALYWIFNKIGMRGAAAAAMGSLGYDVLIRLTNSGINPNSVYVQQYRILDSKKTNSMQLPEPQFDEVTSRLHMADHMERKAYFGSMGGGTGGKVQRIPENIAIQKNSTSLDTSHHRNIMVFGMK